jgi:hypothetical protein
VNRYVRLLYYRSAEKSSGEEDSTGRRAGKELALDREMWYNIRQYTDGNEEVK